MTWEWFAILCSVFGAAVSGALTLDSWRRWRRLHAMLPAVNAFPRIHLRLDVALLLAQLLIGGLSLVWLEASHHPEVQAALPFLKPLPWLRFSTLLILLIVQVQTALDRSRMHWTTDLPVPCASCPYPETPPCP